MSITTSPGDMRYIIRMNYNRVHGWRVRLFLKGAGFVTNKLFSDSKFGGEEAALSAAKNWRDQQEESLDIHRYKRSRAPKAQVTNRRTKSLVTGVSIEYRKADGQDHVANWIMRTVIDGKVITKNYSIKRYGYTGAWRKAVESRIKLTDQKILSDKPPKPTPRIIEWAKAHHIVLI